MFCPVTETTTMTLHKTAHERNFERITMLNTASPMTRGPRKAFQAVPHGVTASVEPVDDDALVLRVDVLDESGIGGIVGSDWVYLPWSSVARVTIAGAA